MLFLFLLIVGIYFGYIAKLRGHHVKNQTEKKKKLSNYSDKKIIFTASFSSKPTSLFNSMFFLSMILMAVLFIYNLAGRETVAELLNIEEISCSLIAIVLWFSFLYICAMTLLYGWVESITTNQFLLISDENIIGNSCKVTGLKTEYTNFEINISQITDTITQKQEKSAGIDMSTFCILTEANRYEFVLLVDESEIKDIISKKHKKSI